MEQGNVIQVFRWESAAKERLLDITEIASAGSVSALVGKTTRDYVDGQDSFYEVLTIVDGVTAHTRRLCWDMPPRCRKERVCVVIPEEDRLEDLRSYCEDFLS